MSQSQLHQRNGLLGILLILGGIFFLLQNLGLFAGFSAFIWVILFAAGGLFFLYIFLKDRHDTWWAAIPGCTLLGLATVIFLDDLGPSVLRPLGGPLFLASIAMGFALVYLATPQNWWALFPAGVLATLALVAGVDAIGIRGFDSGGIFFIGLGVTFLVVALLPTEQGHNMRWAFIPAAILILMGLLIGTSFTALLEFFWPLALIVGGAIMIWRYLIARSA
jgi:hypothetical protein